MISEKDKYLTIERMSEGLYREKGSRFLAFAFPVRDEAEIKEKLEYIRKKYHDARHYSYAWRLGPSMENFRVNDDGEPSNSAGKPILGQIQAFGLTNILIVVVRYFGGTLLGVGGLIKAYKTSSHEALKNAVIIEKNVQHLFKISFGYTEMNLVMKVIKDMGLKPFDENFKLQCELKVKVAQVDVSNFTGIFRLNPNIKIETLKNEEKVIR
jgi:uncharacterized YigZ family protein